MIRCCSSPGLSGNARFEGAVCLGDQPHEKTYGHLSESSFPTFERGIGPARKNRRIGAAMVPMKGILYKKNCHEAIGNEFHLDRRARSNYFRNFGPPPPVKTHALDEELVLILCKRNT